MSHFIYCYDECHNAEYGYAECRYAECRYAECRYAEYRYAECCYAECRGAKNELMYCIFTVAIKEKIMNFERFKI